MKRTRPDGGGQFGEPASKKAQALDSSPKLNPNDENKPPVAGNDTFDKRNPGQFGPSVGQFGSKTNGCQFGSNSNMNQFNTTFKPTNQFSSSNARGIGGGNTLLKNQFGNRSYDSANEQFQTTTNPTVGSAQLISGNVLQTQEQNKQFSNQNLPSQIGSQQMQQLNRQFSTTGTPLSSIAGPASSIDLQEGNIPSTSSDTPGVTPNPTQSRPPPTQDVELPADEQLRHKLLAEKHKNDLYRSLRARAVKVGLVNPNDSQAVGLQFMGENGKHFHITLSGTWADEYKEAKWILGKGDVVNIIGEPSLFEEIKRTKHATISDKIEHQHRLLILHPDIMLTSTAVSNGFTCRRRALLQYEFSQSGIGSKPLVLGNVVHSALQTALANQDFSEQFIQHLLHELIGENLVDLATIGVSEEELFSDAEKMLNQAREWAIEIFTPIKDKKNAASGFGGVINQFGANSEANKNAFAQAVAKPVMKNYSRRENYKPPITRLLGNEQNVCSHRFGLKGKLDGLVRIQEEPKPDMQPDMPDQTLIDQKIAALEIKTGKVKTEHIGQVTVYYLLLCDLVNQQTAIQDQAASNCGLLLYPHADKHIYDAKAISRHDVKGIMQIRNFLAATIQRRRQTLEEGVVRGPVYPPLLPEEEGEWITTKDGSKIFDTEPSECKRCFVKDMCHTVATAVQGGGFFPKMEREIKAYIQKFLMLIDAEEVLAAKGKERPWKSNVTLRRLDVPARNSGSESQRSTTTGPVASGSSNQDASAAGNAGEGNTNCMATVGNGTNVKPKLNPNIKTKGDDDYKEHGLRYLQFLGSKMVTPEKKAIHDTDEKLFYWIFEFPESECKAKLSALLQYSDRSSLSQFSSSPFSTPIDEEDFLRSSGKRKNYDEVDGGMKALPFSIGDLITISKEPEGPYSLFSGSVVDVDAKTRKLTILPRIEISTALRSEVGSHMCSGQLQDMEDLSKAHGRLDGRLGGEGNRRTQLDYPSHKEYYRVDKEEFGGGFSKMRGDLMMLVCSENPQIEKIKRKLVFLEPPRLFSEPTRQEVLAAEDQSSTFSGGFGVVQKKQEFVLKVEDLKPQTEEEKSRLRQKKIWDWGPQQIASITDCNDAYNRMNSTQQDVIDRCFEAEDYCIVQGYPGTGKTEVLAVLLELLVRMDLKVLFCAYTNAAVDNALLRLLKNANVGEKKPLCPVRIGSSYKIHPEIQKYTLGNKNLTSTVAVKDFMAKNTNLVATTLLSCHDSFIQYLSFDIVIVDEASQATEPSTWSSLFKTNKFILLGDTNQLAPLVRHPKAIQHGLGVSLMERLSKAYPQCVAELSVQYRMNQEIQSLPNLLIYENKLQCGTEGVRTRKVKYLHGNFPEKYPWRSRVFEPNFPVVFIDTDGKCEEDSQSHQENYGEAKICKTLAQGFLQRGVEHTDVGILSPYRRQLGLLKVLFNSNSQISSNGNSDISDSMKSESKSRTESRGTILGEDVRPEILTVDEAQGKDKSVIIVSFVKSNKEKKVGQLLTDWRRLNVLLTRAQSKLVLVGSAETLKQDKLMAKMISHCEEKGWLIKYEDS